MFLGIFCAKASHGQQWAHEPKNLPKNVGACPGHHLQLIARNIVFKIFRGEPPPLKTWLNVVIFIKGSNENIEF